MGTQRPPARLEPSPTHLNAVRPGLYCRADDSDATQLPAEGLREFAEVERPTDALDAVDQGGARRSDSGRPFAQCGANW